MNDNSDEKLPKLLSAFLTFRESLIKSAIGRHARAGGHPNFLFINRLQDNWIPAFAGMTN